MKDIKCPLCKEKLEQFNVLRDGTLVEVGCHKCKWSTHPNSPEEAWKEVKELISLFPPIMRISPGDRLAYDGWVCVVTSIDREKCTIDVVSTNPAEPFDPGIEDFTPPIDGAEITPDFVDAWPWELEQEGGK